MPLLAASTVLALAGAVQWQAPVGCPTAAVVEDRVHALLGRVPSEAELHAVGVVSGGPPWRLELETTLGGQMQRRTLEAEDCRAVAEAAAVILAVSVDPLAAAPRAEVPQPDVAAPVPPALVEPARPSTDTEAARGRDAPLLAPLRPRPSLRLRVGGGGEVGAVPGGTGGVRLGLALAGARAFVQVEGSYWIDRFAVLRAAPRSGAWVGLGTVSVQGGVRLGGVRVSVPLALGLEAGGLRTRAEGLARGRDVALPWVAGVVGVGLEWSASRRVALWGAVEGVLPLVRTQVRVGRSDPNAGEEDIVLHEPAVVGARALLGISITINGPS